MLVTKRDGGDLDSLQGRFSRHVAILWGRDPDLRNRHGSESKPWTKCLRWASSPWPADQRVRSRGQEAASGRLGSAEHICSGRGRPPLPSLGLHPRPSLNELTGDTPAESPADNAVSEKQASA